MSKGKVFLTGASGFLGAHIASQLLDAGYTIKASFRSATKGQRFRDAFLNSSHAIETIVVPDMTAPNAYSDALVGSDFVIHCASPFTFSIADIQRDLIDPAVRGTNEIMKAAVRSGATVKRVVITSSFAAVIDPFKNPRPGYSYTENDWNPLMEEQSLQNNLFGYQASKTFAERLAWDHLEKAQQKGKELSLVTFCPPMIFGPVHSASGITSSNPNESSAQLMKAVQSADPPPPARMPVFVDVRDVAAAHVAALDMDKLPLAKSERFLVCGGKFTWSAARECFNGETMTEESFSEAGNYYSIDASKAERMLGMKWTPFERSVQECLQSLDITCKYRGNPFRRQIG